MSIPVDRKAIERGYLDEIPAEEFEEEEIFRVPEEHLAGSEGKGRQYLVWEMGSGGERVKRMDAFPSRGEASRFIQNHENKNDLEIFCGEEWVPFCWQPVKAK